MAEAKTSMPCFTKPTLPSVQFHSQAWHLIREQFLCLLWKPPWWECCVCHAVRPCGGGLRCLACTIMLWVLNVRRLRQKQVPSFDKGRTKVPKNPPPRETGCAQHDGQNCHHLRWRVCLSPRPLGNGRRRDFQPISRSVRGWWSGNGGKHNVSVCSWLAFCVGLSWFLGSLCGL